MGISFVNMGVCCHCCYCSCCWWWVSLFTFFSLSLFIFGSLSLYLFIALISQSFSPFFPFFLLVPHPFKSFYQNQIQHGISNEQIHLVLAWQFAFLIFKWKYPITNLFPLDPNYRFLLYIPDISTYIILVVFYCFLRFRLHKAIKKNSFADTICRKMSLYLTLSQLIT